MKQSEEIAKIKSKMDKLVLRWRGREEPVEKSGDWFKRRGDRIVYSMLKKRLNGLMQGQQDLTTFDQVAYAKTLFGLTD